MKADDLIAAGIPLANADDYTALKAEAALDFILDCTVLSFDKTKPEDIEALPACAKVFVCKYLEIVDLKQGVASQSIEGLSLSFGNASKADLIWQLANSLLSKYLKSQVRCYPARRRW